MASDSAMSRTALVTTVMVAFLVMLVHGSSDAEVFASSEKALHFEGGGVVPGLHMLRGPELVFPAQTSRIDYDFEQFLGTDNFLTFNRKVLASYELVPPAQVAFNHRSLPACLFSSQ